HCLRPLIRHLILLSHAILLLSLHPILLFFFFNDTATTEIYTLSLHDALPIYPIQYRARGRPALRLSSHHETRWGYQHDSGSERRSEEHTSELQSPCNLVCRLLLEKKKTDYRR